MRNIILRDQKGVALAIALLMLLVLTLIGISSMSTAWFETKISGNEWFGSQAFYAAKGGVEVGINNLPNITAYSGNIGSDETYRSGISTSSSPQPLIDLGLMQKGGFGATWQFERYQINATGSSFVGATREVEVQVCYGPFPTGTQYNN
jgi:Tfp pilus assembly protein PilX